MKKYLAMMLCAGMLFAVTGCGDAKKEESDSSNGGTKQTDTDKDKETKKEKVLNCSSSNDTLASKISFTYDKDGKQMKSASAVFEMTIESDELEDYTQEEINESIDSMCESIKSEEAIKSCSGNIKDNKIKLDAAYDIDEFEKNPDLYNGITKDSPIEEVKEYFETNNEDAPMTCTID